MARRAVILAAGMGYRMGELGKSTPKCLLTVQGKSLLLHYFDNLSLIIFRGLALKI